MAVPFLLGAGAVGAGILGAAGMMSAKEKNDKAKRISERAEREHKRAVRSFEALETVIKEEMSELGKLKLETLGGPIKNFVLLYKKISNVKFGQKELESGSFLKNLTPEEFKKLELSSMNAGEIITGGISALSTGALAGLGAYGLVGMLASASTGTAISALSGAAATNATLAWLGGGALGTGSLAYGMAGGMAVLGATVLGPAMLVAAFVLDSNADKALTEAKEYSAEVDIAIEKIEAAKMLVEAVRKRVREITEVIIRLSDKLEIFVAKLKTLVNKHLKNNSVDFNDLNETEKETIFNCVNLVMALKTIIEVKIVKDDFKVTDESKTLIQKSRKLISCDN